MTNAAILAEHFEKFPLNDLGRTIDRYPITKTTNPITGRETLAKGTKVSITAIAARVDTSWTQEEIIKLEGADGFIMTKPDVTLNEQDYVEVDSVTYEIKNLITIKAGTTEMFKYGQLFIKE